MHGSLGLILNAKRVNLQEVLKPKEELACWRLATEEPQENGVQQRYPGASLWISHLLFSYFSGSCYRMLL